VVWSKTDVQADGCAGYRSNCLDPFIQLIGSSPPWSCSTASLTSRSGSTIAGSTAFTAASQSAAQPGPRAPVRASHARPAPTRRPCLSPVALNHPSPAPRSRANASGPDPPAARCRACRDRQWRAPKCQMNSPSSAALTVALHSIEMCHGRFIDAHRNLLR
jgi:hypothetical protein